MICWNSVGQKVGFPNSCVATGRPSGTASGGSALSSVKLLGPSLKIGGFQPSMVHLSGRFQKHFRVSGCLTGSIKDHPTGRVLEDLDGIYAHFWWISWYLRVLAQAPSLAGTMPKQSLLHELVLHPEYPDNQFGAENELQFERNEDSRSSKRFMLFSLLDWTCLKQAEFWIKRETPCIALNNRLGSIEWTKLPNNSTKASLLGIHSQLVLTFLCCVHHMGADYDCLTPNGMVYNKQDHTRTL